MSRYPLSKLASGEILEAQFLALPAAPEPRRQLVFVTAQNSTVNERMLISIRGTMAISLPEPVSKTLLAEACPVAAPRC
jgi:hypothetical protein